VAAGFSGAPRVVGTGFADDGRETLAFISGTTPHPNARDDDATHPSWLPDTLAGVA
jgi:hypothetical protein